MEIEAPFWSFCAERAKSWDFFTFLGLCFPMDSLPFYNEDVLPFENEEEGPDELEDILYLQAYTGELQYIDQDEEQKEVKETIEEEVEGKTSEEGEISEGEEESKPKRKGRSRVLS